ncbi:indole-3-glycerol phosphate synthase [Corynebacterium mustelae]|uniref:Multifunctional fusion protein n=1 Tax=Corynebacterium mustelae TaxID=571915 RepID=A0A0G3H3M4_9CORY|nr:bifunctional indole-3-glycerol-phosphate synthase TrpC/phosphoribosylanthranilate isomerase TrpF [Corynebacterium mustelae]AKK07355.1 indole-3-glycerol phosphate synthase [Corynebacterium mustelae]
MELPNNNVSRETSVLPTVLEKIVDKRRTDIPRIGARIAHVDVNSLAESTRSLYANLKQAGRGGAAYIMECKKASPSLGLIRQHFNPGDIARVYSRYAAGISVLCEPEFFEGDYDHLQAVAATTHLPVLCKDFIIDPVQIHAARYFGADAILLMLSVLSDEEYQTLSQLAARFNMDVLTEVIDEAEVARAIRLGARIFGINHRNLHDLSIDLSRSEKLSALLPEDAVVIAESGIRDNATVRRLSAHCNGFLVGSQLTSQPDIDKAARMLVYGPNKVCGLTTTTAAQAARAVGATYGGLIFEETSPRNVSRETSEKIIAAEPNLDYVAVSRRTTGWQELIQPGITAVQIHSPYQGSIDSELALIARIRQEIPADIAIWRAISMTEPYGPEWALALSEATDMLVLDSGSGGTGTRFDWSVIPEKVKSSSLIAGGISPTNTNAALTTGCAGLDINSGVEYGSVNTKQWHGVKDTAALNRAFSTIRTFQFNTH